MIYIVRHGQTKLNSTRSLQGRSDNPMNETGIAQVQQHDPFLERQVFRMFCVLLDLDRDIHMEMLFVLNDSLRKGIGVCRGLCRFEASKAYVPALVGKVRPVIYSAVFSSAFRYTGPGHGSSFPTI